MQKLATDDPGEIVSSYHRGESVSSIAARNHIGRERVYQIPRFTSISGPGVYRRIHQLGPRALCGIVRQTELTSGFPDRHVQLFKRLDRRATAA